MQSLCCQEQRVDDSKQLRQQVKEAYAQAHPYGGQVLRLREFQAAFQQQQLGLSRVESRALFDANCARDTLGNEEFVVYDAVILDIMSEQMDDVAVAVAAREKIRQISIGSPFKRAPDLHMLRSRLKELIKQRMLTLLQQVTEGGTWKKIHYLVRHCIPGGPYALLQALTAVCGEKPSSGLKWSAFHRAFESIQHRLTVSVRQLFFPFRIFELDIDVFHFHGRT
jgi:hypothetical protein